MAVDASRVTVTNSYAQLVAHPTADASSSGDFGNHRVLLKNTTGSFGLYLGGQDDQAAERFLWDSTDGPLSVDLEPGESIWAVSAGANQIIHILRNGR